MSGDLDRDPAKALTNFVNVRGKSKAWNDAWGNPLFVGLVIYQYGPVVVRGLTKSDTYYSMYELNLGETKDVVEEPITTAESLSLTNWFSRQREIAAARYGGQLQAGYVSLGSLGESNVDVQGILTGGGIQI